MRTLILTSILGLLAFMTLTGCNRCSGNSPIQMGATGIAYEVVVVADDAVWNDPAGQQVKAELQRPVQGLPQDEPSMRITHVLPADFNGMMKYVRNILIVNVDASVYTKVSLNAEKDRWAKGQVVVQLNAPDKAALSDYLTAHPRGLTSYYSKIEMMRMAAVLRKTFSTLVYEKVQEQFGVTLNVPEDFNSYKDTVNFFWASNNANKGRMDVVVYTFPYTNPNTFTKEYLIAMRDSMLGANIPGAFPDSHMATDTSTVQYSAITLQGKYCGVLRGLWYVKGDKMGGPFVSYARLDEVNNRIVVVEGFVYSPDTDKRNYMRRMEAALQTVRLPGDKDQPLDYPEIVIQPSNEQS